MGKRNTVSTIRCPFFMVGVSAVIALLSDIGWLLFDTMIKTQDFWVYPLMYGSILTGLTLAVVLLIVGLYLYATDGLLHHEKKIIQRTEEKLCEKK